MKNTFFISYVKKGTVWLLPFACLAILSSCFKAPDFPDEPSISFKEIKKFHINSTGGFGGEKDSVVISVNFEDGDGDLGTNDPALPNNYEVRFFLKQNGAFQLIERVPTDAGRFPPLRPDGKEGPIEGVLSRYIDFLYGAAIAAPNVPKLPLNDTVKFEVRISDRAQNWSDWVPTDEVIINQK